MKATTEDRLIDQIEKESANRKKELTYVKLRVSQSSGEAAKYEIRAAILVLYAHWEGFIKNISERYLCFVSCLDKDFSSLAPNFYVIQARRYIKKIETQSNKFGIYSDHLKKLDALKHEIVNKNFYKDAICTESNLNCDVLAEIFENIGYAGNKDSFLLCKGIIDESLLGTRNEIAHGGMYASAEPKMSTEQYCELHDKICELIELFKMGVLDMVQNKSYLAQTKW